MRQRTAKHSILTAALLAFIVFSFVFLFAPLEASASDISEMTDIEKVAYYNTNEGQTLYALMNWMASDDYTGDELSEDELAEFENAMDYLDEVVNGVSGEGWYTYTAYVDPSMVDLTDEDDALALENVLLSLDVIDTINSYVTTDDNWVGVDAFTTNFSMLVGSAYTADVSTTSANGHVSNFGLFANTEGLAWGYADPTDGWIVAEKELFDEVRDALGYDVSDGEGLTDDEISAVEEECDSQDITYGHYTNLFAYAGVSSGHVIGVGFNYTKQKTWSYNTAKASRYDASYTTDEMRTFIDAFYDYVEDLKESTNYIGLADITLSESSYTYDSSEHKPEITITLNGETLIEDTDYTAAYSTDDFVNAATITITITGMGDYSGTATTSYLISRRSISTYCTITWPSGYYDYTGEEIEPEVVITDNELGTTLVQGTDYSVTYKNNTDIGSGYVYITGQGNYSLGGLGKTCFTIVDPDTNLVNADITLEYTSAAYTGSKLKPSVTVEINGTELTSGTDYTVSYSNNKAIGTATVKIVGSGDYVNTVYAYFEIYCGHDYEGTVTTAATCLSTGVMTYTCSVCGDTYTETIAKTSHTYTSKVTKAATCTTSGVRTYTCSVCGDSYTKTIAAAGHTYTNNICDDCGALKSSKISSATVTLSKTSYTYNGSARKPTPTVKVNGTTLTKNTDYTVSYSNNTKAGTATVKITGKGSYSGTKSVTFTISKQTLSSSKTSLSYTSVTYSGKAKKPSVTVKNSSGKTLTKGTDYTVSYSNNKAIGKATVTITGKGNYTGTITKTFKIKPKKVSLKSGSTKSSSKKKLTVSWSKSAGGVKYQIAYKKKGSSTWKYKTVSASTYKKTLTGLTSGKYYYVKVRAYKKVNGTTYYGSWSSMKKVKVK